MQQFSLSKARASQGFECAAASMWAFRFQSESRTAMVESRKSNELKAEEALRFGA